MEGFEEDTRKRNEKGGPVRGKGVAADYPREILGAKDPKTFNPGVQRRPVS